MVSEALQADPDIPNVDLSGLHNISHKVKKTLSENVPKSLPDTEDSDPVEDKPPDRDQEMTFAETLSLNSVTTDGYVNVTINIDLSIFLFIIKLLIYS